MPTGDELPDVKSLGAIPPTMLQQGSGIFPSAETFALAFEPADVRLDHGIEAAIGTLDQIEQDLSNANDVAALKTQVQSLVSTMRAMVRAQRAERIERPRPTPAPMREFTAEEIAGWQEQRRQQRSPFQKVEEPKSEG